MTKIKFELDGKQVEANAGETIWQVAKRQGREIPHLCYSPEPDYRPDGNCRACMVEVEGERVLAASCKRTPAVGMKVKTASGRAVAAQKMVMELLVADQPVRETSHDPDSKFWHWADQTGALMPAVMLDEQQTRVTYPDKKVDSLCPYCGVGCQVTYQVKDDKVIYAEGRDGPANHNRLCVKGRFGFDYIHHPHRLTKPLVRLSNARKDANDQVDPANPFTHFREASWEEALDIAAKGLVKIRDGKGAKALAGFGSAKGSNEEAYLFQKLVRTGFGSNNVDHCTRLCHASSVAALMEGLNSGAVS